VKLTPPNLASAEVIYRDRHHAGVVLARELASFAEQSPLLIALPRGGIPVGDAVARELRAELDILLVHKFGVPGHPYISGGALASDGSGTINHHALGSFGLSPVTLERAVDKELSELKRLEAELRDGHPPKPVAGRTVVIVDDGVATGTTMHAAVASLRAAGAATVVVAVPVGSRQALLDLEREGVEVICPLRPAGVFAIAQFYEDFAPVSLSFAKEVLRRLESESVPAARSRDVPIPFGDLELAGTLTVPTGARGVIVFVHGSGSNRFSPRNVFVARHLEHLGFATVLLDLLTAEEQAVDRELHELSADVARLAARVVGVLDWLEREPRTRGLAAGLFGASTGAAAALQAVTQRPTRVGALVSRGGRPDLAESALGELRCPTLLIVGNRDHAVVELNERAAEHMQHTSPRIELVQAGHLFEEPGALDRVAALAGDFFLEHLVIPGSSDR
jgi:putative phosphoribosyl transferase